MTEAYSHERVIRHIWLQGYKKIENRHKGISHAKLNKPIALHVARKAYPKHERHKYYQLQIVQQFLKIDDNTKAIHNDNDKLDQFFSELAGSIIAIIEINKTIKSKDHKNASQYRFANIPKRIHIIG